VDRGPDEDVSGKGIRLEYAPAARRKGWAARKWVLAAGVVVLIYLAAEYGPGLARQVRIQYVQSRVAGFEYSPGTVTYESHPARSVGEDEAALEDLTVWPNKAIGRREPGCWKSLKNILFPGQQFWPPGAPAPKAMVHRLRSSKGEERLVAIIVAPPGPRSGMSAGGGVQLVGMVAAIVAPADWGAEPLWMGNSEFFHPGFDPARPLKIYAGRVDAADPAKFSIPYELDGKAGAIEGRLDDDGEVRMKLKTGG
jgi:hypothetical protein